MMHNETGRIVEQIHPYPAIRHISCKTMPKAKDPISSLVAIKQGNQSRKQCQMLGFRGQVTDAKRYTSVNVVWIQVTKQPFGDSDYERSCPADWNSEDRDFHFSIKCLKHCGAQVLLKVLTQLLIAGLKARDNFVTPNPLSRR
jgi:hypothetical protein